MASSIILLGFLFGSLAEDFAREVGGVLVDPFSVRLPGYRVASAVERHLSVYGTGFVAESPRYALTYRPGQGFVKLVFSDPSGIGEVDGLVRRLRGAVINI